jgi:hypothetical protein
LLFGQVGMVVFNRCFSILQEVVHHKVKEKLFFYTPLKAYDMVYDTIYDMLCCVVLCCVVLCSVVLRCVVI